jgi:hypothetical protein
VKATSLIVAMLLVSTSAAAQSGSQARVHVTADGLFQALFDPFSKRTTFQIFHETATFSAVYPAGTSPALAGGLAVRLWKSVSIGAMVTRVQTRTDAAVEGEIPHPFFFERHRPISGTAEQIRREERAAHLQLRIIIPVTRRFDLSVFGGPSRWRIEQDRIASIDYASEYPFDTARLTGVVLNTVTGMTWGYNAGIDASLYLTNHIGVGGLLLVATANPDEDPTATTADTRIGGLRAGGGIRVRF